MEPELSPGQQATVALARRKAHVLYEGRLVAHRSCGIALAETFGLPSRPYQALRRGGITGDGECGAVKAGELVLGELLGDPDPTGAVTPALRTAMTWYQREIRARLAAQSILDGPGGDIVCNTLTQRHGDFASAQRLQQCTSIAAEVAAAAAEAVLRNGGIVEIGPIPER